ncbi:hypothetical protein D3C71_1617590 [compost metagenome]
MHRSCGAHGPPPPPAGHARTPSGSRPRATPGGTFHRARRCRQTRRRRPAACVRCLRGARVRRNRRPAGSRCRCRKSHAPAVTSATGRHPHPRTRYRPCQPGAPCAVRYGRCAAPRSACPDRGWHGAGSHTPHRTAPSTAGRRRSRPARTATTLPAHRAGPARRRPPAGTGPAC